MKIITLNTISNKWLHRHQLSLATDIIHNYIDSLNIDNLINLKLCMRKIFEIFVLEKTYKKNKDLKCFKDTLNYVLYNILEEKPDILNISVEYSASHIVKYIINTLYKNGLTNTLFVVGGLPVNFIYECILKNTNNTIAVIGEAEVAIKDIINEYISNKLDNILNYSNVSNVVVHNKYNKQLLYTKLTRLNIEEYNYNNFDVNKTNLLKQKYFDIETSRGCPYGKCSFCALFNQFGGFNMNIKNNCKWMGFDIKYISSQIDNLVKNNITSFAFTDSDFVGYNSIENIQRIIDFCSEILKIEKKYDKKISISHVSVSVPIIYNYSDSISILKLKKEMFNLLYMIGLKGFYLGFESGSAPQLKRYNKNIIDINQSKLAKKVIDSNNFESSEYGFMFFDYLADLDDLINNIKFIEDTKLWKSTRIIKIIKIFIGTRYYHMMKYVNLLRKRNTFHNLEYDAEFIDDKVKFIYEKSKNFDSSFISQLLYKEDRINLYHQDFLLLKDIINFIKNDNYCVDEMINDIHLKNRRIYLKSLLSDERYKNDELVLMNINKYLS